MLTADDARYRVDLLVVSDPVTGERTKVARMPVDSFKLAAVADRPLVLTMRVRNDWPYVSSIVDYESFVKVYRVPTGIVEALPTVIERLGAVSYWRFGEPTGNVYVNDENHHGFATAIGTHTLGFTGLTGDAADDTAIDLNGSSGCVVVPTYPMLESAVWSFVGWVDPDTVAAGTGTIAWNVGGTSGGWSIARSGADLVVTTYNGTTPTTATVAGVFTANVWQRVAVTYDGTTLTVNGTTFARTCTAKVGTGENSLVKFGAGGVGTTYNNFFDGTLDEFAYFDRALTTLQLAEIDAAALVTRDRPRDAEVVFYGPVTGPLRDTLGEDGAVELVATSARHYLDRRAAQAATTWDTTTDTAAIAKAIIEAENTRRPLRVTNPGSATSGVELDTYEVPVGRNIGEAIAELAEIGNGFEIGESFIDSDTGDMSALTIEPGGIGSVNANVFLELETRKRNLKSATIASDASRRASNVLVIGRSDDPETPNVQTVEDTAVEDACDALLDTVDTFGDIAEPDALLALAERLSTLRAGARMILDVEPKAALEFRPLDDFDLGDLVSVRTPAIGRLVVDGSVRIWGYTLAVNAEGEERLERLTIDATGAA